MTAIASNSKKQQVPLQNQINYGLDYPVKPLSVTHFCHTIDLNIELWMCRKQTTRVNFSELLPFIYLRSLRYFAECRRKKTLLTCLAALGLLRLDETQQARRNLDVQDRSRLGQSQKVQILINQLVCQIQLGSVSNTASTVLV